MERNSPNESWIRRYLTPPDARSQASEDSLSAPTRLQVYLWVGLVLIMIGVSLSNYDTYQLGSQFDDSRYVVLAKSLIDSPVYGMVNVPGEPGLGRYPFVYPAILAILMRLFPGNLDVLKVPSLICTLLIMVVLFWGWQSFYPKKNYWWALTIVALFGLSPLTIDHSRRVMTEPFFTLFSLLAILLAERYVRGQRPRWWGLAMSAVLILAFFTRSIGIVLIGAVILYLFVRVGLRFWKKVAEMIAFAAVIIALIVVITPVQPIDLLPLEYIRDENARFILAIFQPVQKTGVSGTLPQATPQPSATPAQPPPAQKKSASLATLFNYGLKQHLGYDVRLAIIPVGGGQREQVLADQLDIPQWPIMFGYLVSALTLIGTVILLWRDRSALFLWFSVLYFCSIFFWAWIGNRLLYPVMTQLQLGFLAGMEAIAVLIIALAARLLPRLKSREFWNNVLIGAVCVSMIVASIYKSLLIDDSRLHAGDMRLRTAWLAANAQPGDILLTSAPETDYIYSGLKTVTYPAVTTTEQFEQYLADQHVRFILIAPLIEWQDRFVPAYSKEEREYFPFLDELSVQNRVRVVYASDAEAIRVYQVQP